jgi:hypothetical protein
MFNASGTITTGLSVAKPCSWLIPRTDSSFRDSNSLNHHHLHTASTVVLCVTWNKEKYLGEVKKDKNRITALASLCATEGPTDGRNLEGWRKIAFRE